MSTSRESDRSPRAPNEDDAPVASGQDPLPLVQHHRQRWRDGERLPVEAFLQEFSPPTLDDDELLDLIYNEVVLREEDGESPELDEYLRRFPRYAEELRAQFDVHRALQSGRPFTLDLSTASFDLETPDTHAGDRQDTLRRRRVPTWTGLARAGRRSTAVPPEAFRLGLALRTGPADARGLRHPGRARQRRDGHRLPRLRPRAPPPGRPQGHEPRRRRRDLALQARVSHPPGRRPPQSRHALRADLRWAELVPHHGAARRSDLPPICPRRRPHDEPARVAGEPGHAIHRNASPDAGPAGPVTRGDSPARRRDRVAPRGGEAAPRHQAVERDRHSRGSGRAPRFRPGGRARVRWPAPEHRGAHPRHGRLHGARAGGRLARLAGQRLVQRGRDALRGPHGPLAIPGRCHRGVDGQAAIRTPGAVRAGPRRARGPQRPVHRPAPAAAGRSSFGTRRVAPAGQFGPGPGAVLEPGHPAASSLIVGSRSGPVPGRPPPPSPGAR